MLEIEHNFEPYTILEHDGKYAIFGGYRKCSKCTLVIIVGNEKKAPPCLGRRPTKEEIMKLNSKS